MTDPDPTPQSRRADRRAMLDVGVPSALAVLAAGLVGLIPVAWGWRILISLVAVVGVIWIWPASPGSSPRKLQVAIGLVVAVNVVDQLIGLSGFVDYVALAAIDLLVFGAAAWWVGRPGR